MIFDILITGGTGFVGRSLIKRLIAEDSSICSIQRSPLEIDGVEKTVVLSNFDSRNIKRVISNIKCKQIIHLAAYGHHPYDNEQRLSESINVELLPSIIQNIDTEFLQSVIAIGSCAEYAFSEKNQKYSEDSLLERKKMYGSSKAQGGRESKRICEQLNIRYSNLRLFHTYGYGEEDYRLIPYLIETLINSKDANLSSGYQIRDFIYISDVIDAIMQVKLMIDRERIASEIFNIGSGKPISIREIAKTVAKVCRSSQDLLCFGDISIRQGEIPYLVADISKIRSATGWFPKVELKDGIKKYYDMIIDKHYD